LSTAVLPVAHDPARHVAQLVALAGDLQQRTPGLQRERAPGVELEEVDRLAHVGVGLGPGLGRLADHQRGDLVAPLAQPRGGADQRLGPLGRRPSRPLRERAARGLHGGVDVLRACPRGGRHHPLRLARISRDQRVAVDAQRQPGVDGPQRVEHRLPRRGPPQLAGRLVGEWRQLHASRLRARTWAMAPGPVLKRVLHLPVRLFDLHLGWLLGHRFLLLAHRGRRSGRVYRVVLEVVAWDPATREAVVMSGFGPGSQWYKNVLAGGAAEIRIGRGRFRPQTRHPEPAEAVEIFAAYERRNRLLSPLVRRLLSRQAGFRYDGSDAGRRRLVAALPLVAFRPPGP
jgi:deazaflavin-dependent oxidoreductase (nitroreductase family)